MNFLRNDRRKNQSPNFRQQSVSLFRNLELLLHRKMEQEFLAGTQPNKSAFFDGYIRKINNLLDNIYVKRSSFDFEICAKGTEQPIKPENISSGESELISLAIEVLYAAFTSNDEPSLLLIDEPDVHIHPDLQQKFCVFLKSAIHNKSVTVIIATHSTAIIGSFEGAANCSVAFMTKGQEKIEFGKISDALRRVIPVFGAHPLSNVFNKTPILLVEGEDEVRIWQQAIRSSEGKLKLFPCSVGGIQELDPYEKEVRKIIESIYDRPKALSIRDRDGGVFNIDDLGPVKRMRLRCRTSENLVLSDDALHLVGTSWTHLEKAISGWLKINTTHQNFSAMERFSDEGFDRIGAEIKGIRLNLMDLMGTNKPWEVVVGQSIYGLFSGNGLKGSNSLSFFLGKKTRKEILNLD
ncbi:MAG: AAA family ATPase [Proteobacteria bacterium]|nr:AAA family ATPase [Pseudomonadota bacterium]